MSRSNQSNSNSLPNPCQVWYEWSGKNGNLKHYDKVLEKNIETEAPFNFVLLDEFSTVKGWHDSSQSAIWANEVKNTGTSPLRVSAFKGGVLVEGLYKDIKDKVNALGGSYVKNLYITSVDGVIASLALKGSALSAWMDFVKENKGIYDSAITISGSVTAKKGSVTFKTPKFELVDITPKQEANAIKLDEKLQEFVKSKSKVLPEVEVEEVEVVDDLADIF